MEAARSRRPETYRPRTRLGARLAGSRRDLPENGMPGAGHLLGAAAWGERGFGDDVRGASACAGVLPLSALSREHHEHIAGHISTVSSGEHYADPANALNNLRNLGIFESYAASDFFGCLSERKLRRLSLMDIETWLVRVST